MFLIFFLQDPNSAEGEDEDSINHHLEFLEVAANQVVLDEEAIDAALKATAVDRRQFIGDSANSTMAILARYPILKREGQVIVL